MASFAGGIFRTPMMVIAVLLTAVITIIVANELAPSFFGNLTELNTNLSDGTLTTGSPVADGLLTIFVIVIAISALIGFVGLILDSFSFGGNRDG